MKIFQVNKMKGNFKPYYLDYDHVLDFISKLPIGELITIGLLVDDVIFNKVDFINENYEV